MQINISSIAIKQTQTQNPQKPKHRKHRNQIISKHKLKATETTKTIVSQL